MGSSGACGRVFRGTVFSGRGEGSFYVSIYAKNIRRALGFTPYPGTLNVRIDEDLVDGYISCIRVLEPVRIEPPKIPGARLGGVMAYRASIMGVDSWIVRPDITFYRDDVAEFLAQVYLRKRLGLNDGDVVEFMLVA
ncbi:MAG: DUF120 domain-containing protein [Desulfurococcales archaeon]|nr:DUF120 domain-containing protein [Desulfurococcales archaeon]MCE4605582.1 DUF120 domain-containing protein [Desulfurococcales archaeon]